LDGNGGSDIGSFGQRRDPITSSCIQQEILIESIYKEKQGKDHRNGKKKQLKEHPGSAFQRHEGGFDTH
jgi:hypothetical protein